MNLTVLEIRRIERQGGTQLRVGMDPATIARYAERLDKLPPPIVYHDGTRYWLVDGFQRVAAAESKGRKSIACEVHPGTRREAILCAAGRNDDHGLPLTAADKRHAVTVLLLDVEWTQRSNLWIAEQCRVSEFLVRCVRSELERDGKLPGSGSINRAMPAQVKRKSSPLADQGQGGGPPRNPGPPPNVPGPEPIGPANKICPTCRRPL